MMKGWGIAKPILWGSFNDSTHRLKGAGQSFIERTATHVLCSYKLKYSVHGDGKYLIGTASPKSALTKILSMGIPVRTILKQVSTNVDTTAFMFTWINKHGNPTNTIAPSGTVLKTDSILPLPSLSQAELNKKAFDDSIKTVKTQRSADTLSTIVTAADSIVITIADNEVVDGDTVTVFHNNEVLVSKLFVSAHPYRIVVPLKREVPHS
jgi:hypothetical protein